MTAVEIKTEINKVIEHIPESALQEAFNLLRELQERAEDEKFSNNIKTILSEDKELLKRLAQ